MFISEPCQGVVYAAEPSAKGGKYLWCQVSVNQVGPGPRPVEVRRVPRAVRRKAYRYFEAARLLLSARDPSDEQ